MPLPPPPARRRGLVLGGLALAAVVAAIAVTVTVFAVRRDRHRDPARHQTSVAVVPGDANNATAITTSGDASPGAGDAEARPTPNLTEIRSKLREIAASHDWYAVLQVGDLDPNDPEIAGILANAKQQYLAQQARAIDAQVKQGQCARAKEIAAAAREVVDDDTSLEAKAKACKPHAVPPATPQATLDDATRAFTAGEFARALELAEKLLHADPTDPAATRLAALAACGMKSVDKATLYAAKLRGADRTAAHNLCRKNNIELNTANPGGSNGGNDQGNDGSEESPGAPDSTIGDAQNAARLGNWDKAFSLAEAILSRAPHHVRALTVAATAACHLRREQDARTLFKQVAPARQRLVRQACAQEGIHL